MEAQELTALSETTVVEQTDKATVVTEPVKTEPVVTEPAKKDPESSIRYQISRERERRVEAEKKLNELMEKSKQKDPLFTEETDPDWTKEIDYKIQKWIEVGLRESLEKLWVKETLSQIQYERQLDQFNEQIDGVTPKFTELGITMPTKDERLKMLDTIDKKGITPEQLIALTKLDEMLSKIRPQTFTPWEWKKPEGERQLTQAEIFENVFKKTKAFWR